jgi:predicted phage gp36 major capsid-like protein
VNKPYGLLTYVTGGANAARHPWGAIEVINSGHATLFTADPIIDLMYKLPAAYAPNAKFYSNRSSLGRCAAEGRPGQLPLAADVRGRSAIDPRRLCPDRHARSSGSRCWCIPLLFGDMERTYIIIDRRGTMMLRDPYTNKPFVSFYTTKRVGGGVQNPDAMKAMKIGA